MNIYKLSQNDNNDYDTYDSMVVIAKDEEHARKMNPHSDNLSTNEHPIFDFSEKNESLKHWPIWCWSKGPDTVQVKLIGKTIGRSESRIVLVSYNAG